MIKHLKVPDSEAQESKEFLKSISALNNDFLPVKKEGFVLWPLNFEVEGDIVECQGLATSRFSRDYRSRLSEDIRKLAPRAFEVFGDIAIIRLPEEIIEFSGSIARALLDSNPNIAKVALDSGVEGEHRIRSLELIGGEPGFVSLHKENGLMFKLDVSKVYFSPRLAMERQRILNLIESEEKILDAFAGVAPFSVTLARGGSRVTAVDSNPESEKWAHENFSLNRIPKSSYEFICSRIEDAVTSLGKYDRIIMNNPTKSLSYVGILSPLVRPGGCIHLYCMAPKDGSLDIMGNFGSGFECTGTREVHPYSPDTSLMVFDIRRTISNVQDRNQ